MDRGAVHLIFALLVGCGSDGHIANDGGIDAAVDASIQGPCWPMATSMPGGEIELGTGYDEYRPMPDAVSVVYGEQNGYHFEGRARIRGLDPGEPLQITKPTNPRTRYRAYFVETGQPIDVLYECPNRLGYMPAPDGDGYTSPTYLEIRFDTGYQGDAIFNKQFRIVVEIIDSQGRYATAEKIVTALPPGS